MLSTLISSFQREVSLPFSILFTWLSTYLMDLTELGYSDSRPLSSCTDVPSCSIPMPWPYLGSREARPQSALPCHCTTHLVTCFFVLFLFHADVLWRGELKTELFQDFLSLILKMSKEHLLSYFVKITLTFFFLMNKVALTWKVDTLKERALKHKGLVYFIMRCPGLSSPLVLSMNRVRGSNELYLFTNPLCVVPPSLLLSRLPKLC